MKKKNIIVLYWYPNDDMPMRVAISSHIHALDKSKYDHKVQYLNTHNQSVSQIKIWNFDAIIYHTTVLQPRWSSNQAEHYPLWKENIDLLTDVECVKIAIPQDEYDHAHVLDDWFDEWGVDAIFTNFDETYRHALYPKMASKADFYQCYTGYIDESANVAKMKSEFSRIKDRDLDLVYRATHLPYWFGSHGQLKHEIAHIVLKEAEKKNLRCDISTDNSDVIVGDKWYHFMASGKATIGTESGSSVLDPRGEIMNHIIALTEENPNITFEEVDALLPDGWNDYQFFALSPRHFEAVITKTCQILVEGAYDGVFCANQHYIPLKRDFSNLGEVLDKLKDEELVQKLVDQAYTDIYLSGKYTYQHFAQLLENAVEEQQQKHAYHSYAHNKNDDYILMLTPHDPFHDPRVKWVANMAKQFAPVNIYGSMYSYKNNRNVEILNGIIIRRILLGTVQAENATNTLRFRSRLFWYLIHPIYTFKKVTWKLSRKYPKLFGNILPSQLRIDPAIQLLNSKEVQHQPTRSSESIKPKVFSPLNILSEILAKILFVLNLPLIWMQQLFIKILDTHNAIHIHSTTLYEAIVKDQNPPKLIIVHDIYALPGALRLKKLYQCPVIYDSHEFFPAADLEGDRGLNLYYKMRESRLLQHVDEVVTVSPQIAEAMEKLYSLDKVIAAPNAEPFVETVPRKLSRPGETLKFVFQGGISPYRGIDELLELWTHVSNRNVVLTIRAPQNDHVYFLQEKYEELVKSGHLIFAGSVKEDELISAASGSDIGIIPYVGPILNHVYACPNKLSQYMQAGLAILYCSDLQFVSQKVNQYQCGLSYDPRDLNKFISTIDHLIDNADEIFEMKQNAYNAAKRDFNWDIQSKEYLDIIRSKF